MCKSQLLSALWEAAWLITLREPACWIINFPSFFPSLTHAPDALPFFKESFLFLPSSFFPFSFFFFFPFFVFLIWRAINFGGTYFSCAPLLRCFWPCRDPGQAGQPWTPLCAKGASLAFEGICQLLDLPWGPVAGMTSSCADFTNPVNSEGFFQTLGTKWQIWTQA